jgi:hypothetical protein
MGAQIKTYTPEIREPLPFEAQIGISKKIKYAPIRINYNLRNLQKWNLAVTDRINFPEEAKNNELYRKAYMAGYNLALHSAVGIEFLPTKSFSLRLGYEPKKRREMELVDRSGLIGFSFGMGLKILKMDLSYARSSYHFAGASNHITLSTNLSNFSSGKSSVLFENISP